MKVILCDAVSFLLSVCHSSSLSLLDHRPLASGQSCDMPAACQIIGHEAEPPGTRRQAPLPGQRVHPFQHAPAPPLRFCALRRPPPTGLLHGSSGGRAVAVSGSVHRSKADDCAPLPCTGYLDVSAPERAARCLLQPWLTHSFSLQGARHKWAASANRTGQSQTRCRRGNILRDNSPDKLN